MLLLPLNLGSVYAPPFDAALAATGPGAAAASAGAGATATGSGAGATLAQRGPDAKGTTS